MPFSYAFFIPLFVLAISPFYTFPLYLSLTLTVTALSVSDVLYITTLAWPGLRGNNTPSPPTCLWVLYLGMDWSAGREQLMQITSGWVTNGEIAVGR